MEKASQIIVFDRALVQRHRERAAANFAAHNILFEETASFLIERLKDVKREFKSILVLGRANDPLIGQLRLNENFSVQVDDFSNEEILPVAANRFDLIISNLNLHWVNDLPGVLVQIRNALKSGGLFLASLTGGHTLHEFRESLMEAEIASTGGISPRMSPTIDLPTASALMQRAGFELPVTDMETITLMYPDMFALMRDLRGMGEANAHMQRLKHFTRLDVFAKAAEIYHAKFADSEGRIPATFEIIFLHGWKPALWR